MIKKILYVLPDVIGAAVRAVLTGAFLLLFLLGVYCLYDACRICLRAADPGRIRYRPSSAGEFRELPLSDDAVAWITIYDTPIDYPVMQGKDSLQYINTDARGEYSLSGAIFLDCRNSPAFTDPYSLIYGHHMEGGLMFGGLDLFRNREYFEAHRSGRLITGTCAYDLAVFAEIQADARDAEIFGTEDRSEVLRFAAAESEIWHPPGGGNIAALTTCTDPLGTSRTVVLAELLPAGPEGTDE